MHIFCLKICVFQKNVLILRPLFVFTHIHTHTYEREKIYSYMDDRYIVPPF